MLASVSFQKTTCCCGGVLRCNTVTKYQSLLAVRQAFYRVFCERSHERIRPGPSYGTARGCRYSGPLGFGFAGGSRVDDKGLLMID